MTDSTPQSRKQKAFANLRQLTQPARGIRLRQGFSAYLAKLRVRFQSPVTRQHGPPLREAFQSVFHSSPVAICLTSFSDGTFIEVNDAFLKLVGYTRDEVIGHTSIELNIYSYSSNRAEVMKKLLQEGVLHNFDNKLRTKTGTMRDVVSSVEIVEINGAPHSLAFIDDITDRKLLHNAQSHLAAIVTSSADAIISENLDGVITSWNKGAERIYGYRADEVIGKSLELLLPPDLPNEIQDILTRIRRGEFITQFETIRRHKDGQLLNITLSVSPIIDEKGAIVGGSVIAQDLTEQKRIEKRHRQTQELEIELGKMQEVLALKERFTSMVSHEFRTPLAIIKLASDVLSNYGDQISHDMRTEKFNQIHNQIQHMTQLLEDVLALTKVKSGKLSFEPEIVDLESICNDVIEQMRATMIEAHQLIFVSNNDCVNVHIDERLVCQILINLISNAIKYSPPTSKISCRLSRDANAVCLEIRDSGIGIPLEDQPHLFEPFFRAMNAGNSLGTGLGLAIIKENIDAYGGSIEFESTEGTGTTFKVRLPTP